MELGGAAGERLSHQLGYGISDSSLLYLLSQQTLPSQVSYQAVGVDDFAFRKSQEYGTILIDLEAGRVIDLLPDREAATLAEWLREQPGIEVLARDRSVVYRKAMNAGAKSAQQVVDRFHLLQNLEEALEQSQRAIARSVGISKRTVQRWLRDDRYAERAPRRGKPSDSLD